MVKSVKKVVTTPKVNKEMVEEMQRLRMQELERNVPLKSRKDFESEEAYKDYLLQSYEALRQKEYGYVVRNETMKVYNLACDGTKATGCRDNLLVWDGYKKYIQSAKSPEEKARRRQQVEDCAMGRAGEMGGLCFNGRARAVKPLYKLHCCAISASSVVAQISGEMGYDGDENLIIAKQRKNSRNNLVAAKDINKTDSIPPQYRLGIDVVPRKSAGKAKPQPKSTQSSLNVLVKNGELKIGDSFALAPQNSNSESTGHAMVLVDVVKNDKGEVISYTIQGNNSHELMSIDPNKPSRRGSRKVIAGVQTYDYFGDKIKNERKQMKELPVEELEARVVQQRGKTEQVIADLAKTEQYNAAKGYNSGIVVAYQAELNKKRAVAAEPDKPLIEEQPEKKAENKRAELRSGLAADAAAAVKKEDEAAKRRTLAASLKEDKEKAKSPAEMAESYSADKDNLFVKKNNNTKKNVNPLLLHMAKENAGAGR